MVYEFVAIIVCRLTYLAFRPHRFVMNLGYGFDETDARQTSSNMILVSMLIELFFEGCVDVMALQIEGGHGIKMNMFWEMWRVNPFAFLGLHASQMSVAVLLGLWGFM